MNDLYLHDFEISRDNNITLIGIDEAGRGPLAGPVVAAAVILDLRSPIDDVDDSKKISEKKRDKIFDKIISSAKCYGVGISTPQEIDDINILQATFLAMRRAVMSLTEKSQIANLDDNHILLIDGNQYIPDLPRENQKTIVGGDATSASIAAASIIAKVTRDRMMLEYHEKFPQYNFAKHKGYGTKLHRDMIIQHGVSEIHRKTFCRSFQTSLL